MLNKRLSFSVKKCCVLVFPYEGVRKIAKRLCSLESDE